MSDIDARKFSMFYPKTKNKLYIDYPELEKIPTIKRLSRSECLFAWYFACEASPFNGEEDDKIKAENSFIESFGKSATPGLKGKYISGNFDEKVRAGISEMRKFKIGPRIQSKIMVEKIMVNYYKLIDINVASEFKDKDGEEDWSKKKAYIDSAAKVSSTLPTLINQAEGSFGIIEKEEGDVLEIDPDRLLEMVNSNQ